MHRLLLIVGLAGLALTLGLSVIGGAGCAKEDSTTFPDGGGGVPKGEPCSAAVDCEVGLVCAGDGTCQQPGDKGTAGPGDSCSHNPDCLIDLVCGSAGLCTQPGTGSEGTPCKGNEFCEKGLLCSSLGTCSNPGDPGTKTLGQSCESPTDCALGLICMQEKCEAVTLWSGMDCAEDSDPLRAYFEVPRTGETPAEFYRLPFPNDIRLSGGKVDLSGHPNPGTPMFPEYGDVVGNILTAIGEDMDGFGVNQAVFFRMSKAFDLNSTSIKFHNIDPDSPAYGTEGGYNMWSTTGRGKYICQNYISVRPPTGKPLRPSTTYAVILSDITDSSGKAAEQDADFKAMLDESEPGDADLKAAHAAYKPLRDYLTDRQIDPATIQTAAVFTTMDPYKKMAAFRQVIRDLAQDPAPTDWTLCDGSNTSPCDDGSDPTHACPTTPDAAFFELQGTYQTPAFQKGTPPFKTVEDGGQIEYNASGQPVIAKHESACVALTVPKTGTMPAEGWPVVIFAHGTGGSYRTFINNGTAAELAHVQDDQGTVSRMAVISIDGNMHGPRRGSDDAPDELFFNLRNPRAARDNTYQGAADKYQLVRLVQSLSLDAAASPTGEALKLDPSRIYFFGHSQGTITGIPFLVYEPDVKATVLSGAGGYLIESLLNKTEPVNVSGLMKLALGDSQVNKSHPLLNLLQMYFDEIDAVNYGRALFTQPHDGVDGKHTFLSYGISDSYAPPASIVALGAAMSIRQVNQPAQRCGDGVCNGTESCKTCEGDCMKCPEGTTCGNGTCESKEKCSTCREDCGDCDPLFPLLDPPVKDNAPSSPQNVTAAMVQYVSDGSYDDHFVLFENSKGVTQSTNFLGTAARDESPTIIKAK